MRLLGPNQAGLYFVRWSRSGDEAFVLEIAKDRAAAQGVFDAVVAAWASEKSILHWAPLLKTLYQKIRLPNRWGHMEFLVRDLEPRFIMRGSCGRHGVPIEKVLTSKEMQDFIVAMQEGRPWPPNGDAVWVPSIFPDEDEDEDQDTIGGFPSKKQLAELIRALQVSLER